VRLDSIVEVNGIGKSPQAAERRRRRPGMDDIKFTELDKVVGSRLVQTFVDSKSRVMFMLGLDFFRIFSRFNGFSVV